MMFLMFKINYGFEVVGGYFEDLCDYDFEIYDLFKLCILIY